MKKAIHSLIAFLMMITLPTVQAHAETLTVESAINQLNYKLDVEWDQKDQKFKKEAFQNFTHQIAELQKQGISVDQIVAALKAKMPDAQTAKDVDTLAAQSKNMNSEQLNSLVFNYLQKKASGASWSDNNGFTKLTALIVVSVLVITGVIVLLPRRSGYWDLCYDYYYNHWYDCYVYYY